MAEVLFEKRNKIAYITINRPEVMNSFNRATWEALTQAWIEVRDDPDIWTAIVTGAGEKAFSSGQDMKETTEYRARADRGEPIEKNRILDINPCRDLEVWKPFIAAINGYCLAGGFEVALACDILIAADHAVFGFPEVTRAIIPGAGGTQRLPRLIPFSKALELMITGERFSAREAMELGLISKVVPASKLMETAEALANKINSNGPLAVRAIKESVYRSRDMSLRDGLKLERCLSELVHHTEDAKEGPLAFIQKRKAEYKGK